MVLHRRTDDLDEVEPLLAQQDLAPRDPGDVEQIVHQAGEVADLALHGGAGALRLALGGLGHAEQVEAVADRRQRVAQLVREHGQELVLVVRGLPESLLGTLALGDVAGDGRSAGDPAGGIDHRRDGEKDLETAAILGHSLGLERIDPPALPQPLEDRPELMQALRRDDEVDRTADSLFCGIAVARLRAGVPARHDPVQRLAQDGVLRRLDDARQMRSLVLHPPQLGDVDERHHHSVDDVVPRPEREDAQDVPGVAVRQPHLPLLERQTAQHVTDLRGQIAAVDEPRGDVVDQPADVAVDQPEDIGGGGGEFLDAQIAADEDRGDPGALKEVEQIAVGPLQLLDLLLELGVDRLQATGGRTDPHHRARNLPRRRRCSRSFTPSLLSVCVWSWLLDCHSPSHEKTSITLHTSLNDNLHARSMPKLSAFLRGARSAAPALSHAECRLGAL